MNFDVSSGRVLIVGSLNVDLTTWARTLPEPGETVAGVRFDSLPGGKGLNQAIQAARLGASTTIIGCVGDDPWGTVLTDFAAANRVDVSLVTVVHDVHSGIAAITVDEHAENTIVVTPGANAALTPDVVRARLGGVLPGDVVCLTLEIPLGTVAETMRMARAAGARSVLNVSPYATVPSEVLALADVVVLNEHELDLLLGVDREHGTAVARDPEALEDALSTQPFGAAVVTLGARGAFVFERESGPVRVAAHAVTPVDTTGCGDAFTAAVASGLAAGSTLAHSAELGAIVGAMAATKAGAASSYPTMDEVRRFNGHGGQVGEGF